MSKNITFTVNSLNKPISYKQFSTVTQLLNSREIDQNHVLHSARADQQGHIHFDGPTATVGQILSFTMVPSEKKPGEMRRNYTVLPHLNVADASTLLDYLFKAPNKGSQNSPVQTDQAKPVTGGFGGLV